MILLPRMKKHLILLISIIFLFVFSFPSLAFDYNLNATYYSNVFSSSKIYKGDNSLISTNCYSTFSMTNPGYQQLYFKRNLPDNNMSMSEVQTFNDIQYDSLLTYSLPMGLESFSGSLRFDLLGSNVTSQNSGEYKSAGCSALFSNMYVVVTVSDSSGNVTVLSSGDDYSVSPVYSTDDLSSTGTSNGLWDYSGDDSMVSISFKFSKADVYSLNIFLYFNTSSFGTSYRYKFNPSMFIGVSRDVMSSDGGISSDGKDEEILNKVEEIAGQLDDIINLSSSQIAELEAIKNDNQSALDDLQNAGDQLAAVTKPPIDDVYGYYDPINDGLYNPSFVIDTLGKFPTYQFVTYMIMVSLTIGLFGFLLYGKKG